MSGTSNLTPEDLKYLYASNTNVSNFVSVKLSGSHNYPLWKAQMICLMKSHNMYGIVDDMFASPKLVLSKEIENQYESLLHGWIFGSINEDVLVNVLDLSSAKAVWEELKSIYSNSPTLVLQPGLGSAEIEQVSQHIPEPESEHESKSEPELELEAELETEPKPEPEPEPEPGVGFIISKGFEPADFLGIGDNTAISMEGNVEDAPSDSDLLKLVSEIVYHSKCPTDRDMVFIKGDFLIKFNEHLRYHQKGGDTLLHKFVINGQIDYLKNLLTVTNDEIFLKMGNNDGNTALHLAATLGNLEAVHLFVKTDRSLLVVPNNKGETPLHKAYQNMHFDIIEYLLTDRTDDGKTKKKPIASVASDQRGYELGTSIIISAITAKNYSFALRLIEQYRGWAVKNKDILIAIATTYPSKLDYWESLIYPSWTLKSKQRIGLQIKSYLAAEFSFCSCNGINLRLSTILQVPVMMFFMAYKSIRFLMWMVHLLCAPLYFYLWKIAIRLVAPLKNIEKKKRDLYEARKVLDRAAGCSIYYCAPFYPYYPKVLLEAARLDASEVLQALLRDSPKAIEVTDDNGHDILQLAILHRSENVYNLIQDTLSDKIITYRTKEDPSKNNILHLAGRLSPSSKLSHITGAALQLQRELQWREEVKRHVFPTFLTKENNDRKTPDMVFTEEHKSLIKEGEQWIKATAESSSITAALITTIVFAAAITVPGGNNQDTGIPVFTKDVAFIIFAISDAVSLFTSTTSLIVFLSILTARFSEQDFLVKLPRRLIIGLTTLLISTVAMIVAFGATLFLVVCHQKPWMLAPICLLSLLPVWFFVTLQFPLIVDLFLSTHVSIFGKKSEVITFKHSKDFF